MSYKGCDPLTAINGTLYKLNQGLSNAQNFNSKYFTNQYKIRGKEPIETSVKGISDFESASHIGTISGIQIL